MFKKFGFSCLPKDVGVTKTVNTKIKANNINGVENKYIMLV